MDLVEGEDGPAGVGVQLGGWAALGLGRWRSSVFGHFAEQSNGH